MIPIILAMIFMPIIVAAIVFISHHIKVTSIVFVTQVGLLFCIGLLLTAPNQLTPTLGGYDPGIGIRFHLDEISKTMLFITWFGMTTILSFSWSERSTDEKYYVLIMVLQGALNAYFLTADFFSMFVLLELVTIISSILILYKKNQIAVKAGLIYLLLNAFSMVFFILAIMYVYHLTGSFDIWLVQERFVGVGYSFGAIFAISGLILVFFLKSAVITLHGWLPLAHANAPTAMSGLLSGVLINLGIYGLLRVVQVFSTQYITELLLVVGLLTTIYGSYQSFMEKDVKRVLAYSTMSKMGMIIFLMSVYPDSLMGILVLIVEHFIYKLGMFLSAGTFIKSYNTRKIDEISGVFRTMPLIGSVLLLLVLTACGLPLTMGSIGKYVVKGSIDQNWFYTLYQIQYVVMIIPILRFSKVLFGPKRHVGQVQTSRLVAISGAGLMALLGVPVTIVIINMNMLKMFNITNGLLLGLGVILTVILMKLRFFGVIKDIKEELVSIQGIVVNIIMVWAMIQGVMVFQYIMQGGV